MPETINIFVAGHHRIGGVTSWARGMRNFLRAEFEPWIVSTVDGFSCKKSSKWLEDERGEGVFELKQDCVGKKERNFWTGREFNSSSRFPREVAELNSRGRHLVLRPAVYVPNYLEYGYILFLIARAAGVESRCIGICHTDEPHYYAMLRRYEPAISKFVGVSARCVRGLLAAMPWRSSDIHLVPCGAESEPASRRARNGDGKLRLLYAGRLSIRQKRVLDLIILAEMLRERGVPFQLDLLGEGPDAQLLRGFAQKLRRHVCVRGAIPHQELVARLHEYDVFVLASEFEGTSVAMLEAMASGVVPVVTRVSGAEDLIRDGLNGFAVGSGDVSGMAECIVRLERDRGLLARLGAAATETIRRGYSFDQNAERLRKIIAETMQGDIFESDGAGALLKRITGGEGSDSAFK